ncbi:poly(ADP-ribose) polymerase [Trypanosoma brucei equiperdum]|uniref:Poly [ADP-ribose] polymerase n=1 Tax=Trypanosoma brucei equiperdum TaxID=630700 RepID=A0A3L6LDM5_9TRYP|nr:poly(ADP-ribose) polymerase [Trypanosoma brucei equiperdum]
MAAKGKSTQRRSATGGANSKGASAKTSPVKKSTARKGQQKTTKKTPVVTKPVPTKTTAAAGVKKKVDAAVTTQAPVTGGKRERFLRKGRGVVDVHSGKVDTCHVYERDGTVFQFTLNQTNISSNNNKFYITQLLEDDARKNYFIFARWGRVGAVGQYMLDPYLDARSAEQDFCSKFREKTRNDWVDRGRFKKVPGKYEYMEVDYGEDDDDDAGGEKPGKKKKAEKPVRESKLPKEVQDLMRLIGCRESMSQVLRELEVDTERMPLGKISKAQILRAYEVLKEIEKKLKRPLKQLEELSSRFYTLIPHAFGTRRPPIINTVDVVREKREMLETLAELEVASTLVDMKDDEAVHPLDNIYRKMKCAIQPLKPQSEVYKRIVQYVRNTQGPTHDAYTLQVVEVFTLRREDEEERYKPFKKMDNRQMLWHGSRITNFLGILSQGLRIAPPEAPCTGYMFGKGIYLSDVCSKSANYCHPPRDTNTGLLLLCEVALGKQKEYENAHYMLEPEKGTNSTKGVGRMYPDPKGAEVVKGVLWPKGCIKEDSRPTSLIYPEHIIYDVRQCVLRYLVRVSFEYK